MPIATRRPAFQTAQATTIAAPAPAKVLDIPFPHHASHLGSVAERHAGLPLTAAFASDLSGIILEHQPELWIHGHDHGSHDSMVGRTRILANRAGYPTSFGTRENPNFDPSLVVQV